MQALVDNADELREILVHEVGAPLQITYQAQLDGPTSVVDWYADLLEQYEFVEDIGDREAFGLQNHRWIEKEAAGVVAAIAAYNYPIQLAAGEATPAIAAGCTVVLKECSRHAVVHASALGKLIAEHTDIPAGVVNVITSSDTEVGARLTTHPDIDVVSFTGSTPVGRKIMAAASATVKRVFLELGGKSAFVLLDDGDPAFAAMFCSFAAVLALRVRELRDHVATRGAAPRYDEDGRGARRCSRALCTATRTIPRT